MTNNFYHYFKIVTSIHILMIVLLLLSGVFFRFSCRREKELVMPVEFIVAVPPDNSADNSKGNEMPLPKPKPKPDPKPREESRPQPKPKPKPKHEVKVNTDRVRHTTGANAQPDKLLSREEIEKRLKMGAKPGDRNTPIPDEDTLGFMLVKQALYEAWMPPDKEAAGSSVVEVLIKLSIDGTLIGKRILKQSGNSVMDNSVAFVLNSMVRVSGLSAGFLSRHNNEDITVIFKVQ